MALPKVLMDLARDPDIAPEKFAALVELYQDEADKDAEEAFVSAFLKMQGALPVIDERGTIEYRDGRRGTYARNEDIQIAIGPILATCGFSLTFTTDHPSPNAIRVTGLLTHRKGHTRTSSFESPTDTSGGKSSAQGRGSIISYGHRYTTVDLLNLVTRGEDNDGAAPVVEPDRGPEPCGWRSFQDAVMHAAIEGSTALAAAWASGDDAMRAYMGLQAWNDLKVVAEARDKANAIL